MGFWKFNGSVAEVFPSLGITARPGYVYDLGTGLPPAEPLTVGTAVPSPATNWVTDAGPATDFPVRQYTDAIASILTATAVVYGTTAGTSAQGNDSRITGAAPVVQNVNTVATSGATQTLPNVTADTIHDVTLSASCTFTFPAAAAGKSFLVRLKQGGAGSWTATWPATVKWAGGTAPTITVTVGAVDLLSFVCVDGTSWLGAVVGQAFATPA